MGKHTDGPWVVKHGNGCRVWSKTKCIAFVKYPPNHDHHDFADAHLIAAAPDLLEALEAIVKWVETGDYEESFLLGARAAIARARGEA